MDCEWDEKKARVNVVKHGVDFADAATVLHDELAITVPDGAAFEERFITVGTDAVGQVLVVVYAWRSERPRLISARRASPRERRIYEGHRR